MKQGKSAVTVVGAGIIGICCALKLQMQGHQVTVIDPRPAGTATSFGNAGVVADSMIMPYSAPGLWKQLPWMLCSPMSPMKLRWRYLPRALPWITRFFAQGTVARTRTLAGEIAELAKRSSTSHRELMRAHGIDATLMRSTGTLKLYRNRSAINLDDLEHQLMREHSIEFDVLDAQELRQLEPGVSREFVAAEYFPAMGHLAQSVSLTQAYAEAFESLGGRFVRESVRRFEIGAQGPYRVVTDLGMHDVDQLVIAAGAWSRRLARLLGTDIPLDTERGYHISVDWSDGVVVNRPIFDAEHYFVVAPMRDGLRITSGTEMGGLELEPDFSRIRRVLQRARSAVTGLTGEVNREWMGYRPSMPDSKPVISRSPHFDRVFFAFGHGHFGLSHAAITATLLSEMMAGAPTTVDVSPYRANRF